MNWELAKQALKEEKEVFVKEFPNYIIFLTEYGNVYRYKKNKPKKLIQPNTFNINDFFRNDWEIIK